MTLNEWVLKALKGAKVLTGIVYNYAVDGLCGPPVLTILELLRKRAAGVKNIAAVSCSLIAVAITAQIGRARRPVTSQARLHVYGYKPSAV